MLKPNTRYPTHKPKQPTPYPFGVVQSSQYYAAVSSGAQFYWGMLVASSVTNTAGR